MQTVPSSLIPDLLHARRIVSRPHTRFLVGLESASLHSFAFSFSWLCQSYRHHVRLSAFQCVSISKGPSSNVVSGDHSRVLTF